ncbi:ABC transporter permease [Jeotgalibacillus haloalkalitolerans]|uniref:ABC transporter permease n=1 Tax=Jeotgalibacillus haloalkalitolerans TaxID=3104292 RepID=A0ABU5KPL0_9BACL|nr:ABC transporter permease [Jeotgalibacillus sp. HH7-29]MDZ5713084.1 ABC transporter permease [Jeotgalibacillus sp. HH7-29]
MNRFGLILAKSFMNKVKSRSFIITTIIFTLVIIGATNFQSITSIFDGGGNGDEEQWQVVVYEEDTDIADNLSAQMGILNNSIDITRGEASLEELESQLENGDFDALLTVNMTEVGRIQADYLSASLTANSYSGDLQAALQTIQSNMAANRLSLSADELATLNMPVSFSQSAYVESAKSAEELDQARGLVYVLIFVIYMSVLIYSMMIATEVATEKSSRVMEILISSVPPIQQIFAKILGIGLVGLTQIFIWATVGIVSVNVSSDSLEGGVYSLFDFSSGSISTIIYGVVFFILGYFLYATLAAFLGSLVSRTEDLQQVLMPVNILIVGGALLAFYGLASPEAGFITVTSYIPFFTPLVMFTRVGMLNIPFWEPAIAILLTLLTILVLGWFGAKVYRGGVLMYGNSSSLKDIKQALKLSKKE